VRSLKDPGTAATRTRGVNARSVLAITLTTALAVGCGGEEGKQGGETGSPPARVSAEDVLSRNPYMGVSCGIPNSFACDRVGLAVSLREPAVRVDAAIAGREFELDDPDWSGPVEDGQRRMFAGFLQPAGLIDGPLEVTPDAGPDRWIGREPVSATVDLVIARANGTTTTTTVEIGLSPG
jgi:hypothetical protein